LSGIYRGFKMKKSALTNLLYPAVFFIILLAVWEAVSRLNAIPAFILPAPSMVAVTLFTEFGVMLRHILITLYETFTGFFISVILSIIIAVLMDSIPAIRKTLYPLLVISQTIPIIILAPLFIIWFGYGYLPKIIIVILICFFPIAVSLLQGLASADKELISLLKSMGASKFEIYRFVKVPSALPGFFSGLKIAAAYSIMGATIGEWVGGKNGLGVYMIRAKQSFNTDRVFAAIIVITALSIIFLKIIEYCERKSMPWQKIHEEDYIE
jgi:ABC-type nitrate/sulfonate/bicarbonate transport system permease component